MLFVLLFLGVTAGVNRYLWLRLVRDTRLGRPVSDIAGAVLMTLAASLPLALFVWAAWSRSYAPQVNFVAFSWLGLSFYMLLMFVAWDFVRVLLWLRRRAERVVASRAVVSRAAPSDREVAVAPHDTQQRDRTLKGETRRVFVARSVAGGALLASGGIGLLGARAALWDITTPETEIALPRLPRALDGFSIALLTDIHIGPLLDGRFLRHLVEQTNRLRPDLVVIGGDLVDGNVVQIGEQVAELQRLRGKYGVYFVTGNHEYYAGAGPWVDFLQRLGVHVLTNRMVSVGDLGQAGASFDLAGVPDVLAARTGAEPPDLPRATHGRDRERELVVLAHQPVQITATAKAEAGLQLSGHTHGGQLFPFGALTRLAQPYLAGLYRHQDTDTQIYVSRGSGFWGPPMRVLAPAEIALLHLRAGALRAG